MNVVILAGGFGTRLAEVTDVIPKPMVEIGGRPILWHILKLYAAHGMNDFFIACGYKGEVIKRYFLDYYALRSDLTIDLAKGETHMEGPPSEDWTVRLIDTGLSTPTGGRVNALKPHLEGGTFMVTYGDGVSNVNVKALLDYHKKTGLVATLTAVRPPARFGGLIFEGDRVKEFTEKPQIGEGWINGGFMVFEPKIFDYFDGHTDSLEADVLERLSADGQLAAYKHDDFWQCMDTMRDRTKLEELWRGGKPPWKVWDA